MKYSNLEKMVPIGSFHNIEKCDAFLAYLKGRLLEDPSITILPGHDQKVWDTYRDGI
jgi:hypothetical protein